MRAQVPDAKFAEPVMNRVTAAVRAVLRRWQVHMPPRLLRHPARGYPELGRGRRLDEGQVLRVVRRVVDRLLLDDAAVPDEVCEQPDSVLGPAESRMYRLRHPPGDPHPVAWPKVA